MTAEAITPARLRSHVYKGCARCGGDLRLERELDSLLDDNAVDYVCLQCGRHTPLDVFSSRWVETTPVRRG